VSKAATLRLGTRGSPLALVQAREVREHLIAAHPELAEAGAVEIVVIKTTGDKVQDRTLAEIGGKGLFTKEIEEALFAGRIDVAVHSMKDVPTWLPPQAMISTILPREDPRDAWISRGDITLSQLPAGAVVGTASLRRQAQVKLLRADLEVVPLRGNVETRLAKLERGEVDATLLAVAGLKRLGREDAMTAALSPEEMLPAVAQGAIGLEIRCRDDRVAGMLAALHHPLSADAVAAERACLAELDGSCRTPIAAFAEALKDGERLELRALVALPDGSVAHREHRTAVRAEAAELGREVGLALRAAAGPAFFSALEALSPVQ
jgi:hydroxymethylbilane synthase